MGWPFLNYFSVAASAKVADAVIYGNARGVSSKSAWPGERPMSLGGGGPPEQPPDGGWKSS